MITSTAILDEVSHVLLPDGMAQAVLVKSAATDCPISIRRLTRLTVLNTFMPGTPLLQAKASCLL